MLKPKQMSKVLLTGHKDVLEPTIETLHDLHALHIEEYVGEDYFHIGTPLSGADEGSKKLLKLRSIASFLGIKKPYHKPINARQLSSELEGKLETLGDVVSGKLGRKSQIEADLKDVQTEIHEIEAFSGIPVNLDLCRGYDTLHVFAGTVMKGADVRAGLAGITDEYQFITGNNGIFILTVPVRYRAQVAELLAEYEFGEVKIPTISGTPDDLINELTSRQDSLAKDLESLSSEIDSVKAEYEDFILASEELLSIETQKKETPLVIATSEHTFVIDGWIPDDEFETMRSKVGEATDNRVYATIVEEPVDEANVPIEYDNPKIVKPMEAVMNLYARPKYHEIDPTAFVFIAFPLFYGMILGDIGYGLILLGISLYGRSKLHGEGWNSLFTVLIYCNIVTLIFGILYAEFLGFPLAGLHGHPGLIPGWETITLFTGLGNEHITYPIHRTHLVTTLLVLTLLIGVIHINIGLIAGFRNVLAKHGMKAAVLEKIAWIVLQVGIFLLLFGVMGVVSSMLPGAVVFVLAVAMLVAGEGAVAVIELPSVMTNILSYSRLLAVGLSSIGIATAVNTMSGMAWSSGGIYIVLASVIFILGHALNTALSIIAPGLHALRLQYVEFFTKFYEGGGRIYDPFGYKRIYTEE
ncbi:MAG: V-type ATP synthase subunit I [Candidatus Methanogaster sp.]|uniref:V-type ATP synthase subunit I n=1 Tax=Candidatus Methanogaster sp. TaxID=3386292 RepID=A0AC61L016_9EURY|nr:MAG: V-type ATP synthase subunit I [ANME-2 cluster archaeon]